MAIQNYLDKMALLLVANTNYTATSLSSAIAQLGLAKSIKLCTAALWQQAAAWLATPIGQIAAITAGIYLLVKAINVFSVSLKEQQERTEKAKKALADINDEYEELSSRSKNSPLNKPLTENEKKRLEFLQEYKQALQEIADEEQNKLVLSEWFGRGDFWSDFKTDKREKANRLINVANNSTANTDSLLSNSTQYEWDDKQNADLFKSEYQRLLDVKTELMALKDDAIKALDNENLPEATRTRLQNELDSINPAIEKLKANMDKLVDTGFVEIPSMDGVSDDIDDANKSLSSLSYTIEDQEAILKDLNSELDNIQSAYKTAAQAIKEYNENGYITLDTYKSLMSDTQGYFGYLIDENGQLTINKETLNSLTEAKIDDLAVEQARMLIASVEKYKDDAEKLKQLTGALKETTNAKWGLIEADIYGLDVSDEIKKNLLTQITGYRSLADTAKKSLGIASDGFYGVADAADKAKQNASSAKSAIESLLSMTINMIKQRYNDEKDEYEKEKDLVKDRYDEEKEEIEELIDAYKKKIDAQKEALEQEKEANDYNKSIAEKNADISKLEGQIAEVSNDTSAEGIKKRLELEEELAEKKSDLADYQADHAYDTAVDALDKEYERYEEIHQAELDDVDEEYNDKVKQLDRQIKAIEDYTNNVANLNNEAFDLMQGRSNEYYEDLLEWNRQYGDGVDESIRVAWINAYKSLDTFGLGEKDVLQILNELVSATNDFKLEIDGVTDSLGGATDAATQLAKAYGQIAEAKQEMLDAEGVPYDRGEYDRVIIEAQQKLKLKGYSTGGVVTSTAPAMLHGTSSSPEVVLNNAQASQLFSLINNAPSMITSIATKALDNIKSTFGQNYKGSLGNNSVPSVVIGDINITGNADSNTVQMLKQWQNDTVNKITNILTRKI